MRTALQTHAWSCVDKTEQQALQLSSFAGYSGLSEALTLPLLACHALEVSGQLCLRVNSVPSFMEANRLVRRVWSAALPGMCTLPSHLQLSHHSADFHTDPQPPPQRSKVSIVQAWPSERQPSALYCAGGQQ